MSDAERLYDIICDYLDGSEVKYYEVLGVLEVVKAELIEEMNELGKDG